MHSFISIFTSLVIIVASYQSVNLSEERSRPIIGPQAEVLYLPKGDHLQLLSFGFQNVLSHALWFNTINYFGKHFRQDRNYPWLSHMCDLVTALNNKAAHVYEFCAAMLSWEANKPDKSIELLSRAIEANPDNWYYYYLRAFNYMYFLHDGPKAQQDYVMASTLPGAHEITVRLAQRKLADFDDPAMAITALLDMIKRAKDQNQRQALEKHLKDAYVAQHIKVLNQALLIFAERNNRPAANVAELLTSGLITNIPADPWGGEYLVANQRISSSNETTQALIAKLGKSHSQPDQISPASGAAQP